MTGCPPGSGPVNEWCDRGARRLGGRIRDVGRAAAAGYGQLLFCESPAGGLLLLLGMVPLAPRAAATSAVACVLATLLARVRGYPEREWERGLYSYTAALAGLFWGLLFAPGARAWVALGAAALLAAPATRLAHRLLTPREIPALALPALLMVWLAWPLLDAAAPALPSGAPAHVAGWTLTLAGLALGSRLLALGALVGAAVGLALSVALGGGWMPVLVANTVPTALALGAVFVPASAASMGLAAVAATGAGALAWTLAGAVQIPVLVAPFNAVTVATLLALRVARLRRLLPGRPAPLPLASAGSPDAARAAWRARRRLEELVGRARKICVLTGAGVSTAAGLPDFRGPSGLWTRTRRIALPDYVRSPEIRETYWCEEERFFHLVERAAPTVTHHALAELYRRGRLSAVVTQNVDGLHQAAGLPPEAVIELHGSIREAFCLDCGTVVPRASLSARIALGAAALYCPACQGLLKGGSVMFGERVRPERLEAAVRAVLASDLLLVLGTSLLVAPASDLLRWAREAGIPIAIVNATPTPHDRHVTLSLTADVGAVMLDLVDGPASAPAAVPAGQALGPVNSRRPGLV